MMTFDLFIQTSYSFNGSLLDVDKLITRAKANGFTSLGITDTKNMYATIKFYELCRQQGIQPVIGTLIDAITPRGTVSPFLLYAKNNQGYHNLIQIISYLNTVSASIPWDILITHKAGIIAVSLSDRGDIRQAILADDLSLAADLYRSYKKDFESYFLGIDLTDFT